jgi:hypothetical protein
MGARQPEPVSAHSAHRLDWSIKVRESWNLSMLAWVPCQTAILPRCSPTCAKVGATRPPGFPGAGENHPWRGRQSQPWEDELNAFNLVVQCLVFAFRFAAAKFPCRLNCLVHDLPQLGLTFQLAWQQTHIPEARAVPNRSRGARLRKRRVKS